MTLIDRLRTAVGSAVDGPAEEPERDGSPKLAREVPQLDLEVPGLVETATFALG